MKKYLVLSLCMLAALSLPMLTSCSSDDDDDSDSEAGTIKGHEYVDLGLSVKWATCNLGASSASDYGNYYAWGETSTKSSYTISNCATYNKSISSIEGKSSYDAARANWGGSWRLPTSEEFAELKDNCYWTWTTVNGHKGYKVTGMNGNSIFLPAAGVYDNGSSLSSAGEIGHYWSGSHNYATDNTEAMYLYICNGSYVFNGDRFWGMSVRPVSD
ncbi:MAG: hypothetical protein LUC88_03165 [Prevotella sp.]|nr:hypothetical protein [Prevotella sp.]